MTTALKLQTAWAGALLALMPVQGVSGAALESGDFEGYPVVSNQELAALRGGFELNIGGQLLSLAFSLERVSYLNGELLTRTLIMVPDIAAAILSPQTISVLTNIAPTASGEAAGNPANPPPQIASVSVPSQDAGSAAILSPQTIPATTDVASPASGVAAGNPANPPPQVSSVSVPSQDAASYVTLIQNGAGNSVALPAQVSQHANQQVNQALQAAQTQILQAYNHVTVIQNTLDNQIIQNMTTLNVTLSNAALARAVELNAGLAQVLNMPIVLPQ